MRYIYQLYKNFVLKLIMALVALLVFSYQDATAQITVSATNLIDYGAGGCANNNGCTGCGILNTCSPCQSRREITCIGCGTYDCWQSVPSQVTIRYFQRWHKSLTCSHCNESSAQTVININALKDNFTHTTYGEYNNLAPTSANWSLNNPSGCGVNYSGTVTISGNDRGQNYNNHFCNARDLGVISSGGSQTWPASGKDNNESQCTNGQQNEQNNPIKTVWYKFTTGSTVGAFFDAELFNTNCNGFACVYTTFIAVYEGNPASCSNLSGLVELGKSTQVLGGASRRINCPKPNTTYYIQVDRTSVSDEFEFRIRVNMSSTSIAPDNICDAVNFGTIGPGQTHTSSTHSNVCSSVNTGGHNDPVFAQSNDATDWYYFTTPAGPLTPYRLNFVNVDFGTLAGLEGELHRKTGGSCPPTLSPAGNWDPDGCGVSEAAYFCLDPNTTYYIMADAEEDWPCTGRGEYRVRVEAYKAASHTFCGATDILPGGSLSRGQSSTYQVFSNYCAGIETNEPNTTSGDRTVWLKFKTGSDVGDKMTIDADGIDGLCFGIAGARMNVYTSVTDDCDITQLVTEAGVGTIDESEATIDCPNPDTWYYLQIQGRNFVGVCEQQTFRVTISQTNTTNFSRPANDNICSATNIAGANQLLDVNEVVTLTNQNNQCASMEFNEAGLGGAGTGGKTVWYRFKTSSNPPAWAEIDADGGFTNGNCNFWFGLANGSFYPRVRVYESTQGSGSCTGAGQLSAVPNDADILGLNLDQTFFRVACLKPETWYYIQVYTGFGSICSDGKFDIKLTGGPARPSNDYICGAIQIPTQTQYTYNSHTLTGTNVNATNCFEPNPSWGLLGAGGGNDAGVWYYFDAPGRTLVLQGQSLSSDNIDLQFALYESSNNTCTGALTEVAKAWDAGFIDEDAYFNCLDPGKRYYLMVDGTATSYLLGNGVQGNFQLKSWFPEEGEVTFCNAENIGVVPDEGSITKLNLANKCGVSNSATFGTTGSVSIPSAFDLDKAVIYKFTAPSSGSVKVEAYSNPYYPGQMGLLAGDRVDLQLAVYDKEGANCATANYVIKGSNYLPDPLNLDESLIVNCLIPGREYYLMADGSVGAFSDGYFDIKISDYGKQTPNDFLCNAIPIAKTFTSPWGQCNWGTNASDTAMISGQNNYCATSTNDIPASLGGKPTAWNATSSGVWYTFVAPKSGKVTIKGRNTVNELLPPFEQTRISLALAVFFLPGGYNGDCSNLNTEKDRLIYVGSDYDAGTAALPLLHDEDFTIECLMPDSVYYLFVDGQVEDGLLQLCPNCDRGEFYIIIEPDPRDRAAPNDRICDAIDLGTPALIVDTRVPPASNAATYPSPSTGYGANRDQARNAAGVCMRVENNFCATYENEPVVQGGTFLTDFSPNQTVWYKFTAPSTGEVKINTYSDPDNRGDGIATQIAVFETSDNTCTGTMVGIAANGIPSVFSGNNELTVKCLDPGKTYFVMVNGASIPLLDTEQGYFEIQIQAVPATESAPPNNDICNAASITYPGSIGATTTVNNQTNRCATVQIGVYPDPTTFSTDADVWYTFTTPNTPAPHAVEVTVISGLPWPFGDAMDPQIALYKRVGANCATATFELVDDQYSPFGLPFWERMAFHCLEQNTQYYLMVDGSGLNEQGNFRLEVKRISPHPLPTNDNICDVGTTPANGYLGVLGAATGSTVGNTTTNWHNFCSDVEPGEDALMTDGNYALDQTVWFRFRTPNVANNIEVEIRALDDPNNVGDRIDLQMLLVQGLPGCPFSGTTFTSLTPIASVDPLFTFNATMNVCLPPNTDFYIQVDGSGLNTQGYFTIEVENKGTSSAPANDNICNAKTLPASGVITGSFTGYTNDNNICATLESNEVQHSPGSVQRSVWYKFTAPTSADVTVQVKGNSWVPFSSNYFLPDVTIWEVTDGSNTVGGTCASPNWNKLAYNWNQFIPNTLDNGVYPTVNLTPLCLKPGYTYYVQVDGVSGIGLDGYSDILIKDNQPAYTGPSNNACAGAIDLNVGPKSCQVSGGTWTTLNYGDPTWSYGESPCSGNCGDIWYKFTMPTACGNATQSFVKIEGNDDLGFAGLNNSQLAITAYRGNCGTLEFIKCSTGGSGADPDFSITGTPGETIFLQVWDINGDDHGKDFQICISEQKSADDCIDAVNMELDVPYCFSVASNGSETPNPAIPGSGLMSFCGGANPKHSTYFKFTTDDTENFCDDYYMYIDLQGLAKEIAGSTLHNCQANATSAVQFYVTVWELKSGGTPCTPGVSNVTQRDCYIFNDCGTGSFGINVTGPHGNGGIISDTIWFNQNTGFSFLPNTTYYIVLDYDVNSAWFSGRTVMDGTIEVGRRCKGRVWEYITADSVSTDKHCTTRDGWRHYYDDKGTADHADDKYIFSIFPNGNSFEGVVKVILDGNYHSAILPEVEASYVMRRRWDYQITSGSIDPDKPVKVRFYYRQNEKAEIIIAAQNFANAHGLFYEDFEWFKSANGIIFNPERHINSRRVAVGPNGYSQTGCLSYYDDAGNFIGPPGVQRCNTLVVTDWDNNNVYHLTCNGIQFAEYNGLLGFSGGTGATGASKFDISPLPIELISFTGYHDAARYENVLLWVTASELNNDRFIIEKSPDGINFFPIGQVPGHGTTSVVHNYTFNDPNPFNGYNYYRLKQVDFDGTFSYSNIILIDVSAAVVVNETRLENVYPNPTGGDLHVVMAVAKPGNMTLKVYNIIGELLHKDAVGFEKGRNIYILNTDRYAEGTYVLIVEDPESGKAFSAKFIKQR